MHAVFVAVLLSWTAITTALRIPPTWAAAVQKAVVHVDDRGEEPQQASAENRLSRQSKRDVWGSIDTATTAENANREKAHSFVRDAVRAVGPSVVRIDCEREIPSLQAMLAPGNRPGREMTETVKVSGSGFIVSRDGYILTNAHVVENAKSTVISLANGRSYKAEVVGSDILTDLAVCRISANNDLKVAMLGDSSALSSGDWCIAVGCPVGLDFSCSLGIVSSPLRSASEVGTNLLKGNYIQTTAALNSGNSGGPLVNDLGEVVGINTMVRVNSEAIGFAIPINRAMEIYDILKLGKVVPHAYFGMEILSLTPDFSSINNEDPNAVRLPEIHGVFVKNVKNNSPAAKAGIRKFDVIVEVNSKPVTGCFEGDLLLDQCEPGKEASVVVVRGETGKRIRLNPVPDNFVSRSNSEKLLQSHGQ